MILPREAELEHFQDRLKSFFNFDDVVALPLVRGIYAGTEVGVKSQI